MSKPSAIITTLEDCPQWLDRSLAKGYWEADYFLQSLHLQDERKMRFRFEQPDLELQQQLDHWAIDTFAIITAFNPGSVLLPLDENLGRHHQLQESLFPHCKMLRDAIGQASDGTWQEQGFWALDIDLEQAAAIGSSFGQLAIVCWARGNPAALWWL